MSEHDYPPNADQPDPEEALFDDPEQEEEESHEDASQAVEEEMAKLNDRVLRLAAELENTRRRAAKEKSDAGRYAIANFARDLITVADNFERALQAAGNEAEAVANDAVAGLVSGLQMTEKELHNVFERHGVHRVFPQGEKFDPHLHQAVAQVPSDTIPVGHVVDVAQSGFTIGDRVLRAAMVTVSSGGNASGNTGGGANDGGPSGGQVDTRV